MKGIYVGVKLNHVNIKKFLKDNNINDNEISMFHNKDNDNSKDEYETLSQLYDKKDKEVDDLKERVNILENNLKMANELIEMRMSIDVQSERMHEITLNFVKIIDNLEKMNDMKFEKLNNDINEVSMRVASLEHENMFGSEEEIDCDESEGTPENLYFDKDGKCNDFGWRPEYIESHMLYSSSHGGCKYLNEKYYISEIDNIDYCNYCGWNPKHHSECHMIYYYQNGASCKGGCKYITDKYVLLTTDDGLEIIPKDTGECMFIPKQNGELTRIAEGVFMNKATEKTYFVGTDKLVN